MLTSIQIITATKSHAVIPTAVSAPMLAPLSVHAVTRPACDYLTFHELLLKFQAVRNLGHRLARAVREPNFFPRVIANHRG